MTGYGKAEVSLSTGKLTIEIRTLNGKNADINLKTSLVPKDKEIMLRRKISDVLKRGTIDFYVNFEPVPSASARLINRDLVSGYYRQAVDIARSLGVETGGSCDIFNTVLRFPDVLDSKKEEIITDENWPEVESAVERALASVNEYRIAEGAVLYKDVTSRVRNILEYEDQLEGFEKERLDSVKEKLSKGIEDLKIQPDQSRFEQEMIYYIEKLDINEEKVRLRQHCKYFIDTIDTDEYPGKKLGFIIQEMGREINTTGSKANHAGMQKLVVKMKDELEKIREQSMNIL
jgi:uncharacterized protein (TIGR00255 family)